MHSLAGSVLRLCGREIPFSSEVRKPRTHPAWSIRVLVLASRRRSLHRLEAPGSLVFRFGLAAVEAVPAIARHSFAVTVRSISAMVFPSSCVPSLFQSLCPSGVCPSSPQGTIWRQCLAVVIQSALSTVFFSSTHSKFLFTRVCPSFVTGQMESRLSHVHVLPVCCRRCVHS